MGVIFDGDHDVEGPRSPIAHLDTVLRNLLSHPRPPRTYGTRDAGRSPETRIHSSQLESAKAEKGEDRPRVGAAPPRFRLTELKIVEQVHR